MERVQSACILSMGGPQLEPSPWQCPPDEQDITTYLPYPVSTLGSTHIMTIVRQSRFCVPDVTLELMNGVMRRGTALTRQVLCSLWAECITNPWKTVSWSKLDRMVSCNIRLIKLWAGKDIPTLPAMCPNASETHRHPSCCSLEMMQCCFVDNSSCKSWSTVSVASVHKGLTLPNHLAAKKSLWTCDWAELQTRPKCFSASPGD